MSHFPVENYNRSQQSDADASAYTHLNDDGDEDLAPALNNVHQPLAPLSARIPSTFAGERLDKVLANLFPKYSRQCLQNWIKAGRVQMNGALAHVRQAVLADAEVVVEPDWLPEQLAFTAEPIPLEIVYEDEELVVINKPAGLVVHPATGNWQGTLLNGLLHRYGKAAAQLPRAGIVHRLDKETSGLMVVARTLTAQTELVRQLQARTVKRCYFALVWGVSAASGLIDAPIGRDPRSRLRMAVVPGARGREARTHYRTIASSKVAGQSISAVECALETGRTHQIRVHFAHLGYPLLGDPLYGRKKGEKPSVQTVEQISAASLASNFSRQALHAWCLELIHPASGKVCTFQAPVPDDLAMLANALELPFDLNSDDKNL